MRKNKRGHRRGTQDTFDDDDNDIEEGQRRNKINGDPEPKQDASTKNAGPELDFKQRREMQRKAAAEKRRAKQKCYLCGKAGHVRRECPGIADDGRGESKYSKKQGKGDGSGSQNRKLSGSVKKGSRNRGRKVQQYQAKFQHSEDSDLHVTDEESALLVLNEMPSEFVHGDLIQNPCDEDEEIPTDSKDACDGLLFYDAGCDIRRTLDYLESGRGKHNNLKPQEAIIEYHRAITAAASCLKFGGLISRSIVQSPDHTWNESEAEPLHNISTVGDDGDNSNRKLQKWVVLGLSHRFGCEDDAAKDTAVARLVETISNHPKVIVGVYSDLTYNDEVLQRHGYDRETQLRRLRCTCRAAIETNVAIQVRILPGLGGGSSSSSDSSLDPMYVRAILDLEAVLLEFISQCSTFKVHLSCWTGRADHLLTLLRIQSNEGDRKEATKNIYVGMDGSVSFTKTTHLHECAFEVPLDRLVLETGTPHTIPPSVTKSQGRSAFVHSGHIPFIAEAVAKYKRGNNDSGSGNTYPSSARVAEIATANTLELYPQLHQEQG